MSNVTYTLSSRTSVVRIESFSLTMLPAKMRRSDSLPANGAKILVRLSISSAFTRLACAVSRAASAALTFARA